MTGRLDHAKAKRRLLGRRGERDTDREIHPPRDSLGGWRTEYPEEFPVTVTRLDGTTLDEVRLLGDRARAVAGQAVALVAELAERRSQ